MSVERPFTPALNAEPADWLVERLTDFAVNVSSLVPSGFEAYARVFHPAEKVTCTADADQSSTSKPLRWADVAELTGRTPHQLMQWASIQGSHPELRDYTALKAGDVYIRAPLGGSLPLELAQTLWPILRQHTSTPNECFFAVWEGFGGLPKFIHDAPAFEIPDRRFYLFSAPLKTIEQSFYTGASPADMGGGFMVMLDEEETGRVFQQEPEPAQSRAVDILVSTGSRQPTPEEIKEALKNLPPFDFPPLEQSANLWWPQDRAWCVHTEIDLTTTYLAGSQKLVDALVSHPGLETYQVEPTDKITYDSDTLNPLPDDPYSRSFKIG